MDRNTSFFKAYQCCSTTIFLVLASRITILVWWLSVPQRFNLAFRLGPTGALYPSGVGLDTAGVVFLPWTTLAYLYVFLGGIVGYDWIVLVVALLVDLSVHGGGYRNRDRVSWSLEGVWPPDKPSMAAAKRPTCLAALRAISRIRRRWQAPSGRSAPASAMKQKTMPRRREWKGASNMNRSAIPLGRILGIPIGLDYSWFLIFALLTWSLATSYYPAEFKNWPVAQYWIVGAVTAILMFASVLLHELGHSVVAMRYKIPVRSITLFIFGGVAQIGAEPPSAIAEFWIAIAGPVTSFALAIFFGLLQPMVGALAPLLALAKYLAYINGSLALFNLIPGFPVGWWSSLSGHRLGDHPQLAPSHPRRRQFGAIHCLSLYPPGSVADVHRPFRQWLMDCLHRLVPGERRSLSDPATDHP